MQSNPELVRRFHRVLIEEIVRSAPEYLERPFTVAEIYQSLVPYRTHRDRLGVEMNGDYEDILLRLLAGERDLLILESEPARRRIRKELESPNPNTGIYRQFAAVGVRLDPGSIPDDIAPDEAGHGGPESGGGGNGAAQPTVRNGRSGSGDREPPHACPECETALPARETLRFCPACGTDVHLVACASCGEELERGWRYCVACGTPTER